MCRVVGFECGLGMATQLGLAGAAFVGTEIVKGMG